MEFQLLHTIPVELLLNILDSLNDLDLVYVYKTDTYIRDTVHDNKKLLDRYNKVIAYITELKSNFNSTQLEHLKLIKDKYPDQWNMVLNIKSKRPVTIHSFFKVIGEEGFDSSKSRVIATQIVIFFIRETYDQLYDVYITDISRSVIANVGSGYWSEFSTQGFSQLENGIAIYLNTQQINLLSDTMFDYL